MPNVVFQYFQLKGLGEAARLLLTYGGQEFDDVRVPYDKWAELKPETPFGQMPVLIIDGKKFSQSLALSRYLGKKYGLGGATLEEDLEIDQNVDFLYDIRVKAAAVKWEKDETVKEKKHQENLKNVYPDLLARLDKLIKQNDGHLACGKLTWADFVFAGVYDALVFVLQIPDIDDKYPAFRKLQKKVLSLPQLQTYLASAPKIVPLRKTRGLQKSEAAAVKWEKDETVKEKKHQENLKNVYPDLLARLDKLIKHNNGHLACGKLTWADFVFAGVYDALVFVLQIPDIDDKYPAFRKLQKKVLSLPQLQTYLASAPKSDF